MENDWYDRLLRAIERDERSPRAISLAAGCGPNYLQQMMKDGKRPGVDRLLRILAALGSASSLYVLTGVEFTDEDEELFRAIANLDDDLKPEALSFFRKLQAREAKSDPLPSPED